MSSRAMFGEQISSRTMLVLDSSKPAASMTFVEQGWIVRPQAAQQRCVTDAAAVSGFNRGETAPRGIDPAVTPGVPRLHDSRCPAAVSRLIAAIVVNAFQRHSAGRARTNVENEVLKIAPSLTDTNSSTAIPRIGFVIRVCASLIHSEPNPIFLRKRAYQMRMIFLDAPA